MATGWGRGLQSFSSEWTQSRTCREGGLGCLNSVCSLCLRSHRLQRHPPHHTLSSPHFSPLLSLGLGLKCPPAYGTVLGEVEPLKWEVSPVKMSHWERDFEGHRVAGALSTSWFIKMNTRHTMDRLPPPWPVPQSGRFVIVMRQTVTNIPSVHTNTATNKTLQSLSVPFCSESSRHRRPGKAHTGIWQSE